MTPPATPPKPAADERFTPSDIPVPVAARPEDAAVDYARDLGDPGRFPFTRGVQPTMYRGRHWTMRQYAGFGTAGETNVRFKLLLAAGQTGLSTAFDLPTQMGIDSDSPRALGEVGRVGVAIDTVDDMHALLADLPLDRVSTSMTINATAAVLLAMYVVVAEERGIPRAELSGTVQNDVLKEYIARGTYIYPPEPSLSLIAEMFRFCAAEVPQWNPISISGYHIREAGATAVQEVAFTFANAMEYVRRAVEAGLAVDAFAPRLSFFFAAHNDLFEEVAKFRAARRLYARLMRERFGASDASARLRFHTQTGGVTLQAQQPLNNVVRVAVQALAAVLGGTQSLHTNGYDEALALPTAAAATLALRTQQIVAYESGAAQTADPLAGELLRRGADRRAGGARPRAARAGGRAGRRPPRPSRAASSRRRSRAAPTSTSCASSAATRWWWA
jgi:methylmalonyl-CoA mutase N-terminal domain/subunit